MILDDIAAKTRERVERARLLRPLEQVQAEVSAQRCDEMRKEASDEKSAGGFTVPYAATPSRGARFTEALARPGLSFICEVKRASPSAGLIAEDFDPLAIAETYEQAGADALSVLTEPDFFLGSDQYLADIAVRSPLPALRKDFVLDEYQLYEARLLGASAVLLIVALLDDATLQSCIACAGELGLAALVETHDAREVQRAQAAGAPIIGINNRDLTTFTVDLAVSERLRALVEPGILVVAESGLRTPADLARMQAAGVDGVLIGEALMRSDNVVAALAALREAALAERTEQATAPEATL